MTQALFTETPSQSWYNNVPGLLIGASILFLIVGIIFIINWGKSIRPIPFGELKPNSQAAITSFLQLQTINCTLNGQPIIFTMGHYLLNDAQCGILLQNAAGNKIYITYYEFLNWFVTSQGILYVPSRVLQEDVPTNVTPGSPQYRRKDIIVSSPGNGYSLYYNSSNNTYIILSSLNTSSNSFIKYIDANNVEQTVATDKEPDIVRQ